MIFIRTDSNLTISGGHIMRCLAIAKELMKLGIPVCFLIADTNPVHILDESGVPYVILYSNWMDLSIETEQVRKLLEKENHPVLLIDTYQITKEYVNKLHPYCKIAYLGSKLEPLGELDLLINYSSAIDYDFYKNNYDNRTTLLLGPLYTPLREEFQNIKPMYREQVARILVTTGNTDRYHMVDTLIRDLYSMTKIKQIKLDVIVGPMFEDKDELHKKYDNDPNVILHDNVKSMAEIMKTCDLAISANGTTVYELSAVGLPTISFAMVEEQVKSAKALSDQGVIDYCGHSYENPSECVKQIIKRTLHYLINNKERIELAKKAHKLIGGNGIHIISKTLCSLQTTAIR